MANKENENNNSSTSLNIGQKVEKIKEQAGLEIDDLKQFKNNQEISSDIEKNNDIDSIEEEEMEPTPNIYRNRANNVKNKFNNVNKKNGLAETLSKRMPKNITNHKAEEEPKKEKEELKQKESDGLTADQAVRNATGEALEVAKDMAKKEAKKAAEKKAKATIITFIMANLPIILIGLLVFIIILIIVGIILFFVFNGAQDDEEKYHCSSIPMKETSLSKSEFVDAVTANISQPMFVSNASKIYEIAVSNDINPELVIIRAVLEGFSPGINYNYWGIGCTNTGGIKACITYTSFDEGVLSYITNISKYDTVEEMMASYSYLGDYWYNPGGSGIGGCYYLESIKEFLSEEAYSRAQTACSGPICNLRGGTCTETSEEDREAYTKWQVSKMVETRETIFGLSDDACDEVVDFEDDGTLGAQVAAYAISTYDSWSYSQSYRESEGYVDCSSMVARAYAHFGVNVFRPGAYSYTSSSEYQWCKTNNKLISESSLRTGDLIFFTNSAGQVHHVSMYIDSGRQFAAHTAKVDQADQVSLTNYNYGSGRYFCHVGV